MPGPLKSAFDPNRMVPAYFNIYYNSELAGHTLKPITNLQLPRSLAPKPNRPNPYVSLEPTSRLLSKLSVKNINIRQEFV